MNDNLPAPSNNLQVLLDETDRNLSTIDHSPFSDEAFNCLKSKIGEYTIQLINESAKTAKRRKEDVISTNDVEHAGDYLTYSSGSKMSRNIGTLGGILLGAGLSTFLGMIVAAQFGTTPILIALVLTVLGMFMVSYQIVKE